MQYKRILEKLTIVRLATVSLLFLCSMNTTTTLAQCSIDASVEIINSCELTPEESQAFVLFDQNSNSLYGWSHIVDNPDNFPGLKQQTDLYRVDGESVTTDNECANIRVFKTVLVKKYDDWDQQHATGLDTRFPEQGITFADVKEIVLEVKINSEQTFIPSLEEYLSTYKPYTGFDELLEMDRGKVNLGVTIFEENADDQNIETFQGSTFLELNQKELADQWLRVVIPAQSLSYFVQLNYENTEKELADYLSNNVVGIRINPETGNGRVLRNYISDTFDENVPEMYKEMGISIRKVAIRLNDTTDCADGDADCSGDDSAEDDGSDGDGSDDDSSGGDNTGDADNSGDSGNAPTGAEGDNSADDSNTSTPGSSVEAASEQLASSGGGSFGALDLVGLLFLATSAMRFHRA
ncbi:MAG: hypothetical protein P8Y45_14295 [Exilibacterium sp.]